MITNFPRLFVSQKNPRKSRGETILEVMVAISIFSVLVTAVFAILGRTITLGQDTKDRIQALSIAQESIEAVRNLRDTNWLRFSGSRDELWLCYEVNSTGNICKTGKTISETKSPYLTIFSNNKYTLRPLDSDTEIDTNNPNLSATCGTTIDNIFFSCQLSVKKEEGNRIGRLIHDFEGGNGSPTRFFREVFLTYEKEKKCGNASDNIRCEEQRLKIEVYIFWYRPDTNEVQRLKLEAYLYNFLDRNGYPE